MAKRADDNDGSCREILTGRLAGRWRVQFTQTDEFGRKSRLSRVFPTKTEGKRFLQDLRKGVKVETARATRELTLGGWFDWLVEHDWPESLDEKTIAARRSRFDRHVRPLLGDLPLGKIDPLKVRAFYKRLREHGVGEATVHSIKANLVRVFNQAQTPYARVPATQANPFRLTLQAPALREAVALTPDEGRDAICRATLAPSEQAMLATFLLAGLRLSELMALTKGQILFGRGLIAVDRAVKLDGKGAQTVGLPKGGKKRLAVLCPTLERILVEYTADMSDEGYLWSAESGNRPRMKGKIYLAWKRIIEKTGLPSETSPHDCRLTHVNWIEKLLPEVSPTTLKEHVGHASGRTVTEINYTRPLTPAQDILRRGIEGLVAPPKTREKTGRVGPSGQ